MALCILAGIVLGRLRNDGVPVWYAPEDIMPGEKIYDQVKKAIATFDRLLVVLSSASMNSEWVKTELANAVARGRREGRPSPPAGP